MNFKNLNKRQIIISVLVTTLLVSFISFLLHRKSLIFVQKNYQANLGNIEDMLSDRYQLIGDTCYDLGCLFKHETKSELLGRTLIRGYYTKVGRVDFGNTPVECDSFTITWGEPDVVESYINAINEGNTLSSKNDRGEPVVNINLVDLGPSDRQKFLSSTENSEVELVVFLPKLRPAGVNACFSTFQILKVQ